MLYETGDTVSKPRDKLPLPTDNAVDEAEDGASNNENPPSG